MAQSDDHSHASSVEHASLDASNHATAAPPDSAKVVDEKFQQLSALLDRVEPIADQATSDRATSPPAVDHQDRSSVVSEAQFENRLIQARLGLASSLLIALRCR